MIEQLHNPSEVFSKGNWSHYQIWFHEGNKNRSINMLSWNGKKFSTPQTCVVDAKVMEPAELLYNYESAFEEAIKLKKSGVLRIAGFGKHKNEKMVDNLL